MKHEKQIRFLEGHLEIEKKRTSTNWERFDTLKLKLKEERVVKKEVKRNIAKNTRTYKEMLGKLQNKVITGTKQVNYFKRKFEMKQEKTKFTIASYNECADRYIARTGRLVKRVKQSKMSIEKNNKVLKDQVREKKETLVDLEKSMKKKEHEMMKTVKSKECDLLNITTKVTNLRKLKSTALSRVRKYVRKLEIQKNHLDKKRSANKTLTEINLNLKQKDLAIIERETSTIKGKKGRVWSLGIVQLILEQLHNGTKPTAIPLNIASHAKFQSNNMIIKELPSTTFIRRYV